MSFVLVLIESLLVGEVTYCAFIGNNWALVKVCPIPTECHSCDNLFCHIKFTKIIAAVPEHRNVADGFIRLINTAVY